MMMDRYEVNEVASGLWDIVDTFVHAYLIVGDEKALLIDCGGTGGDLVSVVNEITGGKPVILALTHADEDHISSNAQTGFAPAHMHPAEFAYYATFRPGAPVAPIQDGEVIDLGGREVEAILTPGHTQGSMAYIDRKTRSLIAGDGVTEGVVFIFGTMRNVPAFIVSMERLKARAADYDVLYPSHGAAPMKHDVIDRLITAAHKLLAGELEGLETPPPLNLPASVKM